MDQREAINKVKIYKALLSKHFAFDAIYLFGSYANDSGKEDSDIDVAVVASNISGDFFAVNPLLWKIRREVDDRIEPVLIDKNNDKSGFLDEIQKTGIKIG